MTAARYAVKHVEVEAVRFDGSSTMLTAINRWIETGEYTEPSVATRDMRAIIFQTGEGDVTVEPGDWIIRDALGEFYPCKPDIFAANFEAVS